MVLLLVNRDQSNAYRVKIAFEQRNRERSSSFDGPVEISILARISIAGTLRLRVLRGMPNILQRHPS